MTPFLNRDRVEPMYSVISTIPPFRARKEAETNSLSKSMIRQMYDRSLQISSRFTNGYSKALGTTKVDEQPRYPSSHTIFGSAKCIPGYLMK